MRVLVIDDSREFRERIAQYLGAAMPDAELTLWDPARHGKPTVGFDWRRYDALLLDDTPGDGQDGLEWLREFRAEGPVPPTLVLSDSGGEDTAVKAIKAGAEEAIRLGLPVTCHCLDVFLAAEAGFAGVEHHWAPGMTSISDVKKRWEIHERRMTGKINTADVAFYYEPENFDKIIKAMAEKQVSWSPTIATWFRPLSPSAERFKERELSILNNPKARYLPAVNA